MTTDGTESRQILMRIRDGGVSEILEGLGEGGFFSLGNGRLSRLEDCLLIELCANTGRYDDRIKALSLVVEIPLTETEKKFRPKEERDEPQQISPDFSTAAPQQLPDRQVGSESSTDVLSESGNL